MRKNKPVAQNHTRIASNTPKSTSVNKNMLSFNDNRPEANRVAQFQQMANDYTKAQPEIIQKKNNTGLPDKLKSGIENLSGFAMDDVKVHYNSSKPAQLQAHAFAQGSNIHLAPGQEKHLPHEAWHVVQQKQGRVNPTLQLKAGMAVNDDISLEKEADIMGEKALQMQSNPCLTQEPVHQFIPKAIVQRAPTDLSDGEQIKPGPPPTIKLGSYFYKVFNSKPPAETMKGDWDEANSEGIITPSYRIEQVRHSGSVKWAFRSKAVDGRFFQLSKAGHPQRVVDWVNLQTSTRYLGRLKNIFTKVRTNIGDGQGFFENEDGGDIWFIDINTSGTSPNAQDVVTAIDARITALEE